MGADQTEAFDQAAIRRRERRERFDRATDKPVIDIWGGPGRMSRDSFRELWDFREVLSAFVTRQVKVRYKQAAIGIGWVVLQPLLAAAIFAVFLGHLSNLSSEGVPYLLFALTGTAGWSFFSSALTTSSDSLVRDQGLLRKLFFPREILPLSAIAAGVIDLIPALATVAIAAALYGTLSGPEIAALPLPVLILVTAAAALGLILSALNVNYRDVRLLLPFLLQVALFATPVVWSLEVVPSQWRTAYAILWPPAAAIDGIRRIFAHGAWPSFGITFGALGWSLVLLIFTYWRFKRLERSFSDRV